MNGKHTSLKRAVLKLLCLLLGLILAALVGVTWYFHHLLGRIQYVPQEQAPSLSQEELDAYLSTDPGAEEEPDAETPTMKPEDVVFQDHDTQIGGGAADLVNILLIGQDRRPGEERARSDVMILCTFNKDANTLTMTSFLRDLYVQIPGYQDNRINTAYAAGGMPLLKQTLQKNFGLEVDGCVEVDFTRFSQIIDLLGGVTLELRSDEAISINKSLGYGALMAGVQHLSGEQALLYARIRHLDGDGDFSRTERQRKVISALLEAYRSASLTDLLALLEEALPMLSTDMESGDLVGLATELFPMLSGLSIISQRIPADGTYEGRMIRGMSVLVADLEAARALLEETLLGLSN